MIGKAPPAENAEIALRDLRLATLGAPARADPDIVLVLVTPGSGAAINPKAPLDRAFLAALVAAVDAGAPRAIGFDVLVDRPTSAQADQALRAALLGVRAPLVAARTGPALDPDSIEARLLAGVTSGAAELSAGPLDDVVRDSRRRDASGAYTFAAALAAAAGRTPAPDGPIPFAAGRSGAAPFWAIPAESLLAAENPAGFLAGRIVIIGGVFPDQDRHLTPMRLRRGAEPAMAGVYIQAFQTRRFLDGQGPRQSLWLDTALATLAAGLVAGAAMARGVLWLRLAIALGGLGVVVAVGVLAWPRAGLMADLGWIALASAVAWLGSAGFIAREARRRAGAVRVAFERYLAPEQVARAIAGPDPPQAGASARVIAYLITDIEDFTGFIARTPPQEAAALLNGYLDAACGLVRAHGGIVDKIVGDSVHALFLDEAAAGGALSCARALDARLNARPESAAIGRTRIGASFGEALVGAFGGAERLDFTAHGPAVNLAARLQHAAKALGETTLASGALIAAAGWPAGWRRAPDQALQGFEAAQEVWALERGGGGLTAPLPQ